MRRYDTLLLDADMTLFDFRRSEDCALRAVLSARGCPTDDPTLERYKAINDGLWAANARGEISQEALAVERFAAFGKEMGLDWDAAACNADYLEALASHGFLLPGAEEFCTALVQAGCRLAIVTNGLPRAQWGRLEASPLRPLIGEMFVSMELGCQKPQRAFFDKVFAALSIAPGPSVAIMGDSLESDVLGGHNAGIDSIWFNPEKRVNDAFIVPTFEVSSYEEALEVLLGCNIS